VPKNSKRRISQSRLPFGLACILTSLVVGNLEGQISSQVSGPPANTKQFVESRSLPAPVKVFVTAFGNRLQVAGKGRTVLHGTYTSKNGSGQAQLVWETPGSIRFDRVDKPDQPLIFNATTGFVNRPEATPVDSDILESLMDDAAESFFYSFQGPVAHRFLGAGFRADDGSRNDIYESVGPVRAQPGQPSRLKHYYFDSHTKLLGKTHYLISDMDITTEFNKWTTINGQSFPGEVVRKENGSPIFTFTVDSAAAGPSVNDNTFSGQ